MTNKNSTEYPLVSILMTAYNRENYIEEAIESVLSNSYQNFELIIVDDGSKDQTLAIANNFANKDSRIKVFVNEKNLGDYPNRNKAAEYATGKYLKYLDADDIIYEHSIDVMVKYMEMNSDAAFGLSFNVIDDLLPYPQFKNSNEIIRSEYLNRSYLGVGPSASIIKRDKFIEIGGFSGKQYIGDTELWLNLASKYSMVLMNPSLVWWRTHTGQQMQSEFKNPHILIDRLNLSLNYLETNKDKFSETEFLYALKRKKQHFSRMLLSMLYRRKTILQYFYLLKNSGLNFFDFIMGFRKYYK